MTILRHYRLHGAVAVLIMFATMDTVCGGPWPYGDDESVAPPAVVCRSWSPRHEDCGRLCNAGFWTRATQDDVRTELANGADPTLRDDLGYSPLHLAVRCARSPTWTAHPEVIAILLDAGADPNRKGPKSFRPLHMAARHAHPEIVELLIDAGAEIDASDDRRMTALHHAAFTDQGESIGVLIKAGADPELLDKIGHTPLMLAAWQGNLDALRALIEAGVDLHTRGHDHFTALHHAVEHATRYGGSDEAATILLNHGANRNLLTDEGESACDLAYDRTPGWTEVGTELRGRLCSTN